MAHKVSSNSVWLGRSAGVGQTCSMLTHTRRDLHSLARVLLSVSSSATRDLTSAGTLSALRTRQSPTSNAMYSIFVPGFAESPFSTFSTCCRNSGCHCFCGGRSLASASASAVGGVVGFVVPMCPMPACTQRLVSEKFLRGPLLYVKKELEHKVTL